MRSPIQALARCRHIYFQQGYRIIVFLQPNAIISLPVSNHTCCLNNHIIASSLYRDDTYFRVKSLKIYWKIFLLKWTCQKKMNWQWQIVTIIKIKNWSVLVYILQSTHIQQNSFFMLRLRFDLFSTKKEMPRSCSCGKWKQAVLFFVLKNCQH